MATYTDYNHGIEGKKLEGTTRRIEFKQGSLRRHPITNTLMVTYELDRNCRVTIVSCCNLSDEEKAVRCINNIHLEEGDSIESDAARLYLESNRNCLSQNVKEGVSGRHGATIISTPKRAIAIIKTPLHVFGNKFVMAHPEPKQIKE